MTKTKTHKKVNHTDSKPALLSSPIHLDPFSGTWLITTLAIFFFFIVSIGALAGFFEVMHTKYPHHFRYHREIAQLDQVSTNPAYNYIPLQYQSKSNSQTIKTGFMCEQPSPSVVRFFNPFDIQSWFDESPSQAPIAPSPSSQQITVIIR